MLETVAALLPYITLANHDDVAGSSTSMGNGVSHPATSFVFRCDFKTYPGQQVYLSYGKISFQQKLLSFGWLDRAEQAGWFAITVLPLHPSGATGSIELKTDADLHRDVPAKVRAAAEERLRKEVLTAVRAFQDRGGRPRTAPGGGGGCAEGRGQQRQRRWRRVGRRRRSVHCLRGSAGREAAARGPGGRGPRRGALTSYIFITCTICMYCHLSNTYM